MSDAIGWVIDHEADAAYLVISKKPIAETKCYGMVNIDVDDQGNAVGVELMTLKPLEWLPHE